MFSIWVFVIYGLSFLLAVGLLLLLGPKAWYWHILSICAAIGLGLIRFPPEWAGKTLDYTTGFVFIVLFFWGLGALFVRKRFAAARS